MFPRENTDLLVEGYKIKVDLKKNKKKKQTTTMWM